MQKLAALLITTLLVSPAMAGNTSVYTKLDINKCRVLEPADPESEYAGSWLCKGYKGKAAYEVLFAEDDLRGIIAFGRNGGKHCGFRTPFGHFNAPGDTLEWRLRNGKPIATILRWTVNHDVENPEDKKTWLVVSKLENGNSCQMAYVEGAYPNANAKAQELADTLAPGFSCASGTPQLVANAGTNSDYVVTNGCSAQ